MADYSAVCVTVPPTDIAEKIVSELVDALAADGAFIGAHDPDYFDADEVRWGGANDHISEALAELRRRGHGFVLIDNGPYDAGVVDVYKPGFGEYTIATREGDPVLSADDIRDIKAVAPNAEDAIDEMLALLTIPKDLSGWVKEPA